MTFQGIPDQQWAELMDRREKASLERTVITHESGRVSFQPPVETMLEQEERYEPKLLDFSKDEPFDYEPSSWGAA